MRTGSRLLALGIVVGLLGVPASADEPPSSPAPQGRLTTGSVVLLSLAKHGDSEKATFSFEKGVRDDPGLLLTRNDWELRFGSSGDVLEVCLGTDDRSAIADLGAMGLADVEGPLRVPDWAPRGPASRAVAAEGHVYLVHTRDADSDHLSLVRVKQLVPGDRCTLEWVHWAPETPGLHPLDLDAAARDRLARTLDAAADAVAEARRRAVGWLGDPVTIRFQVRTDSQGGNSSRIHLDGTTSWLPPEPAAGPFDVLRAVPRRYEPLWYRVGGYVPKGSVLVVEAVDVLATAPGDSNGHGEAVVALPDETVFSVRDSDGPFHVWFAGRALVRPGEEGRVFVAVANSSALDVRIHGRLLPAAEAADLPRIPFFPEAAPAGVERVGGAVPGARPYLLEGPRALLQVHAGDVGSNPNRVTLLGRGSIYLDRLSATPLSLETPAPSRADAVGYTSGGRIPRGKAWLVTRATWVATASGDRRGGGEAVLQVGRERLLSRREGRAPLRGVWKGEIRVRPGEEAQVYVEVAHSSTVDAVLEGRFADLEEAERLDPFDAQVAFAVPGELGEGGAVTSRQAATWLGVAKAGRVTIVDAEVAPGREGEVSGRHQFPPGTSAGGIVAYYQGLLANAGWTDEDFRADPDAGILTLRGVTRVVGAVEGEGIEVRVE